MLGKYRGIEAVQYTKVIEAVRYIKGIEAVIKIKDMEENYAVEDICMVSQTNSCKKFRPASITKLKDNHILIRYLTTKARDIIPMGHQLKAFDQVGRGTSAVEVGYFRSVQQARNFQVCTIQDTIVPQYRYVLQTTSSTTKQTICTVAKVAFTR